MNEKLSITLPAEMVEIINDRVEAGVYASSSDVVNAAMRTLLDYEEEHEEVMASIRARVKASLNDPRPSPTSEEMSVWIQNLTAKYR